jgi:hypothetical protein
MAEEQGQHRDHQQLARGGTGGGDAHRKAAVVIEHQGHRGRDHMVGDSAEADGGQNAEAEQEQPGPVHRRDHHHAQSHRDEAAGEQRPRPVTVHQIAGDGRQNRHHHQGEGAAAGDEAA